MSSKLLSKRVIRALLLSLRSALPIILLIALALGLTTTFPATRAQGNAIYMNYEVTGTEHQLIRRNLDPSAAMGRSERPLPKLPLTTNFRQMDLSAAIDSTTGLDAPQQSRTGPIPPPEVLERDARRPPDRAADILSASNLPVSAYGWRHGCGPTAVGMVVGYYDTLGYDYLIPGSATNQTDAVNQAIASGGDATNPYPPGSERHYEDYARPQDSDPNLLTDDYITSARIPHVDNSIADYMDTSKSTRNNYYGWSWSSDVGPAWVGYVEQQNPAYVPSFQEYHTSDGTLTWPVLTREIDAGRPMVFLVDTDGSGDTDHFVTIIGYRTSPSLQYGCWDTWSTTAVRWENFAPIAPGTPWGIWGGWALSLGSVPAPSQSGLIPAVVYVTGDGHIHEIALKGTWQDRDLTAAAGAPVTSTGTPKPKAYRRSDGVSMVIYRGQDDHVQSLYLELRRQGNAWQEVWHWADLSAVTGSPATVCDPYGYVRSDGISTVVYAGTDGHIHELRLEGGWIWADLTAISGAPAAWGCPIAYVRGDGINAIVYKDSSEHIYELWLDDGWKWADLTALSGAPRAMSGPSAYVRSDGISTINYTGYDGHIHDIRLEGGWIWADLTAISGAPGTGYGPFGYVRSDGMNTIVYATTGATPHRIYELRLDNGWQYYELTSVPNAVLGYPPVGHVRADGISAVVYLGTDWHIHEIWLQTVWHWADLTYLAGAPDAASYPWAYNRSVVTYVYLPLIVRQ